MDQLFRLKDTLVGYLSPSKRRRTVGPGTPTRETTSLVAMPMSEPTRKVTRKTRIIREFNVMPLSPTQTKKFPAGSRKRAREEDEHDIDDEEDEADDEDDEDGDEGQEGIEGSEDVMDIVEDDSYEAEFEEEDDSQQLDSASESGDAEDTSDAEDSVDPEDSASQAVNEDETGSIGDVDLDVESELSAEAKVKLYLENQKELENVRGRIDDTIAKGEWTEDESFLLQRLAARSFEPLLPVEWQIDFRTWPQILFTTDHKRTFINYNNASSSRGVKALQALVALAGRVRDKKLANRSEERLMFIEINRYIKWSQEDGGYSKLRFIPNIVVVAGRPDQTAESLSRNLTTQMDFLAHAWRKSLALHPARTNELGEREMFYSRTPPIIYGIVIAHSHAIFWTIDSSKADAKPKFIWHFDVSEKYMDVWNAIAVAIFVIMARNYMMSIKYELEEDEESSSDPDL